MLGSVYHLPTEKCITKWLSHSEISLDPYLKEKDIIEEVIARTAKLVANMDLTFQVINDSVKNILFKRCKEVQFPVDNLEYFDLGANSITVSLITKIVQFEALAELGSKKELAELAHHYQLMAKL